MCCHWNTVLQTQDVTHHPVIVYRNHRHTHSPRTNAQKLWYIMVLECVSYRQSSFQRSERASGFITMPVHNSHAEGHSRMKIKWISEFHQVNQPGPQIISLRTVGTTMTEIGPTCCLAIHWCGTTHWNKKLPILLSWVRSNRNLSNVQRTLNYIWCCCGCSQSETWVKVYPTTGSWTWDLWHANSLHYLLLIIVQRD